MKKYRRRTYRRARNQRGAALLIFAVILVLGSMLAIVAALNAVRNDTAAIQISNATVLQQAKSALLGYVAIQAGSSSNAYPGKLPCPEDPNPSTPYPAEGTAASYCSLPAIGRLPWRTLGIDKLTDSAGEPLWYVLSPGFNRASSGTSLKINSNTPAQLTLDGTSNAAIALIIAPGKAMNVQAATGCTARSQVHSQTYPFDYRDYLECDNATSPADSSFVSVGPTDSFNDQVLAVSHTDVFNVVDAAVAKRIETDIVPALQSVYASAQWNATATTPRFPFAAPFGNPDTSSYTGSAGTYQGLLPLSYSKQTDTVTDCVVSASDPRCNPSLVAWKTGAGLSDTVPLPIVSTARISAYSAPPAGYTTATISVPSSSPFITVVEVANSNTTRGTLSALNCNATTSTQISCGITYGRACSSYPFSCTSLTVQPRVRLTVRALNVANAFKAFDTTAISASQFQVRTTATSYGASPLGVLRSDGDADITTEWLLPSRSCTVSQCSTYTVTIPIALIVDYYLANSGDSVTGWFLSNEWHKLTYYAVSTGNAPGGGGTCVAGGSPACLTVNAPSGTTSPNALLILAGRNIGTGTRPSSSLGDYLEGANADGADTVFAKQPLSTTFNDRVSSIYP